MLTVKNRGSRCMKKAQSLGHIPQDLHDHFSVCFVGYIMSFTSLKGYRCRRGNDLPIQVHSVVPQKVVE